MRHLHLLGLIAFLFPLFVSAETFIDDTQAEFGAGTHNNTIWDVNHVELGSGQTSGTFTSQVFDGGGDAAGWSQLGWSETLTSVDKLVAVDVAADVWKSIDNAPTWSLVKDDYNSTDGNNATDLVIDGNKNVFILNNQAVWKSTDAGVSWVKVNSDYNGAEAQNGVRIARDGSNNLYITEADEDIWYSADSGANWTKKATNINGGNGNAGGLVGISSILYLADAQSDIWKSTDSGASWNLVKDDYNGADGNGTGYMVASAAGNIYIVFNQAVWKSTDAGVSWTKITTDYNGSEAQSAVVAAINSSGHLFIAEGDEDIWRSTDDGTNWIKQATNFNGGNGNIVGLGYVSVITDITFGVRSGSTNPPTDSFAGSLTNPSGGSPGVSSARYFQYRATFSSEDSGVTPELASVTVTYTPPDTTAPSAVSNLSASGPSDSAITLTWTSPGDDGGTGTAAGYDLRYSTSNITEGNFSSATAATGEPTPLVAGTSQSLTVTGLSQNTTYFFAIKTSDEVPNTSAISNVASLATTATPDTVAPAAVSNLSASDATASSVVLSWTAPGDDGSTGAATSYDVRYATSIINDANWSGAAQVSGEPSPQTAGTSQSMTVSGLSANATYYFALKSFDEVPNTSAISNVTSLATIAAESSSSSAPTSSGSGGGVVPRVAVFSGQAYPGSKIEVLRKSIQDQIYVQTPAETMQISKDGAFSILYTGIMGGDYLFALRATDKDGRSTGALTFDASLFGDLFEVKDILMPPTIGFEKSSIVKNEIMKVVGYAAPNNKVELEVDGLKYKDMETGQSGLWSFDIDTAYLSYGEHSVRAKQTSSDGKMSNFSLTRIFKLLKLVISKTDLTGDGIVNISDWSIFLFRWGSDKEELRSQNDLNADGKVNVFDFSIFLQAMKL